MLTACLVQPDDLDAITRIVISQPGGDVFGGCDGVAGQCSDLISGFEAGLGGCRATDNALDYRARRLFERRPRIAELGGGRVAQFGAEERRRPDLHCGAFLPGLDLVHDAESALDRSGVGGAGGRQADGNLPAHSDAQADQSCSTDSHNIRGWRDAC